VTRRGETTTTSAPADIPLDECTHFHSHLAVSSSSTLCVVAVCCSRSLPQTRCSPARSSQLSSDLTNNTTTPAARYRRPSTTTLPPAILRCASPHARGSISISIICRASPPPLSDKRRNKRQRGYHPLQSLPLAVTIVSTPLFATHPSRGDRCPASAYTHRCAPPKRRTVLERPCDNKIPTLLLPQQRDTGSLDPAQPSQWREKR
jgi:hypothetical protein